MVRKFASSAFFALAKEIWTPFQTGLWRCWSLEPCISRRLRKFWSNPWNFRFCWENQQWRRPIARTPWSLQRAVARWGYCVHLSEDCMETAMPSIDLCSSSIWFLSWRPFEMSSKTIVKPWKCVFNDIESIHINLQNSPRTQIVQRDLGEESLRRRLIRYWAVTKTFSCWLYIGDEKLPSYIHSMKLRSRTWKWMIWKTIFSFPFGAKNIFSGAMYLLVWGRVGIHNKPL